MKKGKQCDRNMECWSGFAGILGVAFIVIATILTLITMNGVGILGMFIVGIMLCRRKMVICPCYESIDDCSTETKPKAKKAPAKK